MSEAYVHEYLPMQARGNVTLPAGLRKKLGLDRPGVQLELTERPDGVIELRPTVPIPASQAWYWTPQWQAGEQEARQEYAAGQFTRHDTAEDFLAALPE